MSFETINFGIERVIHDIDKKREEYQTYMESDGGLGNQQNYKGDELLNSLDEIVRKYFFITVLFLMKKYNVIHCKSEDDEHLKVAEIYETYHHKEYFARLIITNIYGSRNLVIEKANNAKIKLPQFPRPFIIADVYHQYGFVCNVKFDDEIITVLYTKSVYHDIGFINDDTLKRMNFNSVIDSKTDDYLLTKADEIKNKETTALTMLSVLKKAVVNASNIYSRNHYEVKFEEENNNSPLKKRKFE